MKFKINFDRKDLNIPEMLKKASKVVLGPDLEMVKTITELQHKVMLAEGMVVSYREQLGNFCIGLLSEDSDTDLTVEEIALDLIEIFRLENEVLGEED